MLCFFKKMLCAKGFSFISRKIAMQNLFIKKTKRNTRKNNAICSNLSFFKFNIQTSQKHPQILICHDMTDAQSIFKLTNHLVACFCFDVCVSFSHFNDFFIHTSLKNAMRTFGSQNAMCASYWKLTYLFSCLAQSYYL